MPGDKVELRGFVDPLIIQVLDAICQVSGKHRMGVLEPVLLEWAKYEIHKSSVVLNVTNGNGIAMEVIGKGSE